MFLVSDDILLLRLIVAQNWSKWQADALFLGELGPVLLSYPAQCSREGKP